MIVGVYYFSQVTKYDRVCNPRQRRLGKKSVEVGGPAGG